jgi:hypothetical protein
MILGLDAGWSAVIVGAIASIPGTLSYFKARNVHKEVVEHREKCEDNNHDK